MNEFERQPDDWLVPAAMAGFTYLALIGVVVFIIYRTVT